MKEVYSQKTQDFFPRQIIWFGWVFIAGSLIVALSNWVVGSLFASLSLLVISGREGITINFRKRKIKYYWGVLGLKFGSFEDLPEFGRITLSPRIHLKKGRKIASSSEFEVRLWYKEVQDYALAYVGKHAECIKKGRFLSKKLRVPMADLSKSNGRPTKKKGLPNTKQP